MADNNIIRVTKAQKLEAIKKFIPADASTTFPGNDTKAPFVFNYDAIIAFLDTELAALAKKNSDKKPTKAQEENEKVKEAICAYLEDKEDGATCAQVAKDVLSAVCPDEATPQKASSMFRLLKNDGRVSSKEVKGRTYFFLV